MFEPYSVRVASTSKANTLGVLSLNQILRKSHWSKESKWQKLGNKETFSAVTTFQSTLGLQTEDIENPVLETCTERLVKLCIR